MKKIIGISLLGIALLTAVSCKKEDVVQSQTVTATLTTEEKADMNFLREEEKLARDVYLYAYDMYGASIFLNISKSEQSHMDNVLQLLTIYNLPDPASNVQGVFNNEDLQSLYYQLIQQVDISFVEALKVGATIEDLDIYDLELNISHTTNADLLNTYESLVCGSKNHIRNFVNSLNSEGASYTPQYISQAYYDEILSEPSGPCGSN